MKLIVGLGNPGEKYKNTRHNLGFEVVDKLVDRLQGTGYSWKKEAKFKAEICNLQTTTYNLILAKPQTYMNNSGLAVSAVAEYFKISPEDIIVVHDDLDLALGKIQIKKGGSAAGHHGVESVIENLGTDQFIRIRLGIGPGIRTGNFNAEQFVLEKFKADEKVIVEKMVNQAVEAVKILLQEGLEKAQNQINSRLETNTTIV